MESCVDRARIRQLYEEGVPTDALAERFCLSRRRIQEIIEGLPELGIGPAPWASHRKKQVST